MVRFVFGITAAPALVLALVAAGTGVAGAQTARAIPVVEGAGAFGQATSRNGAMAGGTATQGQGIGTPNQRAPSKYNGNRRVYPQAGPDTVPGYPRGPRRLGYDNDNDFSGGNGVQRGPSNTNPDRRQLEDAFDD